MEEIAWKNDMRSFQVEYMPANNLIIKINEMLDKICNEFPEVDRNTINVLGESDTICMGDYDQDITVLTFNFKRNLTQEEIDMRNWEKENIKKRQILNLQKLIRDNIEDTREYLKELGFSISERPVMKRDCAEGITEMFRDEYDNFTKLSKARHEYMKENEE
jgi:aspartyl/asparaginyl-tRNA synthetase